MFQKLILIWGFEQGTAPAGGFRGGAEGPAPGFLYMKVECVMLLIFCYCPTGNLVKAGVFYFSWMCFLYLSLFHSPWGILSSWLHRSMSREKEILLMAAPSGVLRSQTYMGNSPPLAKKIEHARKTRGLWGYWLHVLAQTWRNGLKCCWVCRHRQDYESCGGAAPSLCHGKVWGEVCDEWQLCYLTEESPPVTVGSFTPGPRSEPSFLTPLLKHWGLAFCVKFLQASTLNCFWVTKREMGAALNLEIIHCWDVFQSFWSDKC